jgi:hypothetical protein
MTQSDKELVLKELCTRLPYSIVINVGDKDIKLDKKHQCIGVLYPEDCSDEFNERHNNASFYIVISGCYYGEEIKPYLRPMSSMTEEERKEYNDIVKNIIDFIDCPKSEEICFPIILIDWLNAHHFDYRGLIEKCLALEAPKGMYKID